MNKYQNAGLIASHLGVYFGIGYLSGVWQYEIVGYASIILAGLLIWISIKDAVSFTIPDLASLLLVISGLVVTGLLYAENLMIHAVAGLFWGALFWGVSILFRKLRGYDGLGLGDAKLMVGAGVWLGLPAPISVVLFAALSGIAFILVMRGFRGGTLKEMSQSAIAFGPFLCLSIWSVWTFGPLL
ncbi:MAG: A24 family peptidase [Paracoccaceae bacterium]